MLTKDEYTENLVNEIVAYINNCPCNDGLSSVILTGSMGRNEGSFSRDEKNDLLVLDSDVEIALVYKKGAKKKAELIKNKLMATFEEDMNPMTISEKRVRNGYNFNGSVRVPKKSSIFMYDLYNGSRTIWGEDLISEKAVEYDKYEAKRIVANRIGELIYIERNEKKNTYSKVKQWEYKVILAIGSAYCILNNAYESKYSAQRDYIMSHKNTEDKIFGVDFVSDYDKAYQYLRVDGDYYEIPRERIAQYVAGINTLFSRNKVEKPQINSTSRKVKYAVACVKSKAKLNPITCETAIIDDLIAYFITGNYRIIKTANNWKAILY